MFVAGTILNDSNLSSVDAFISCIHIIHIEFGILSTVKMFSSANTFAVPLEFKMLKIIVQPLTLPIFLISLSKSVSFKPTAFMQSSFNAFLTDLSLQIRY